MPRVPLSSGCDGYEATGLALLIIVYSAASGCLTQLSLLRSSSSQSLSVSSFDLTIATACLNAAAAKLASVYLMSSSNWCPTCATGYYDFDFDFGVASKKLPFASSRRITAEPQYLILASDPSLSFDEHYCGETAAAVREGFGRRRNSCLSLTSTYSVTRCDQRYP